MNLFPRLVRVALASAALVAAGAVPTLASSHREAPLITEDPVADNTDTYAFVDPKDPDKVVLIANWIPLEDPAGGPNFFQFGEEVRYDINIDNDGDAEEDITYEFRFRTRIQNRDTFLYNTNQITSLDDPDYNNRQTYRVTRRERRKPREVFATALLEPPVNIGPRSTPDYEALARAATYDLPDGSRVFVGQRDEAFFVDLGSIFDLLGLRPFNPAHLLPLDGTPGVDGTSGFNVHTIALQIPKDRLLANDPVIGVWSSTYRRQVRVFDDRDGADLDHDGPFVQISRLGMPLVNEVVIPLRFKDRFNASEPEDDGQFARFVLDPEPARLIPVLYPVFTCFPTTPRNDLVSIFLTGIDGLNKPASVKPAEMIRLNTSIAPTPLGQRDRLGLLAGQLDGFPNGRRLEDDVVDIELRALAGATPLGDCPNASPNRDLGDGVDANDLPFLDEFPYLPTPHQGYAHPHDHAGVL
jgi:hypothetical protein